MRLHKMNYFFDEKYDKTCRDLKYLGVECCQECHESPDNLRVVKVDGAAALVCCEVDCHLYPPNSPEEKLLRAIFGEVHDQTARKPNKTSQI